MLFSNTLKATAAASLLLACAGVNAQSSWNSSQDLGLFVNPTKGIPSNVTIGASPTSSLSNTRLTVKSEAGQGGLKVINSEGSTKLWLNEKGGLSVGTSSSATTNGLLVSGQTRLRANLVVDNGAEIKGGMKLDGETTINLPPYKYFTVNSETKYRGAIFNCNTEINNGLNVKGGLDVEDGIHACGNSRFGYYKDTTRFGGSCIFQDGSLLNLNINGIIMNFNTTLFGGSNAFAATIFCEDKNGKKEPLAIRADKLYIPTKVYINKSHVNVKEPAATLHVDGDALIEGKLTCKDKIEVAELKANDIQMDMHGAADYVFDENYNLKSLSEVESYVNENKHLPGMPSAAEMEENGVSVSKMTNLLLEKVEELTLHMIQLEKENAALKAKVESLSK